MIDALPAFRPNSGGLQAFPLTRQVACMTLLHGRVELEPRPGACRSTLALGAKGRCQDNAPLAANEAGTLHGQMLRHARPLTISEQRREEGFLPSAAPEGALVLHVS